MTEIIKIESRFIGGASAPTCNARDLWQFVESKQDFSTWIKARIEKYGFVEGEDFTVHKFVDSGSRGQVTIDYHLSIDMAKEVAMVENNAKGRQVRRYFIACEKRSQSQRIANNKTALDRLRSANALKLAQETAARLCARFSSLGESAQRVIYAKIINPIMGDEVLSLPAVSEKLIMAGEVGRLLGVSANMIGRIANRHDMKTDEYGEFRLGQSEHGAKPVGVFHNNLKAVERDHVDDIRSHRI